MEDRFSGPKEAFVMMTSLVASIMDGFQLGQDFEVCGILSEVLLISTGHIYAANHLTRMYFMPSEMPLVSS